MTVGLQIRQSAPPVPPEHERNTPRLENTEHGSYWVDLHPIKSAFRLILRLSACYPPFDLPAC